MRNIPVSDPTGAVRDPGMPFLAEALDPVTARRLLGEHLLDGAGRVDLRGIRVARHKPGRRCIVEYALELLWPDGRREELTVLGKARARGLDAKGYRVQRALRKAGFDEQGSDLCVPETLGVVPAFHMWLQRKVPGVPATDLLAGAEGTGVARRIAGLSHALHRTGVPPLRPPHAMADELRILRERLPRVADGRPRLADRLERLLVACERLGARVPEPPQPRGIHRDFYADQVLVDGDRLYLLDLDLYCAGDPAVDVGNFLGHVTEWSLRELEDPNALADQEEALAGTFSNLSPDTSAGAVRAYASLTLARHVHISTLFPERRASTEALLGLCEERLGIPGRHRR